MINTKTILNPHTSDLQLILDQNTIADKNHNHQLSEVIGLATILSGLINGEDIKISGGYFIN